jgi:hypothetical protein
MDAQYQVALRIQATYRGLADKAADEPMSAFMAN